MSQLIFRKIPIDTHPWEAPFVSVFPSVAIGFFMPLFADLESEINGNVKDMTCYQAGYRE